MTPAVQENNSEIARKAEEFLEYLQVERGSSPLTIRNYRHYLRRFNNWLESQNIRQTLKDINQDIVRGYRVYLANLGLGRRTQGYHLIALRSFLKWLRKEGKEVFGFEQIEVPKFESSKLFFLKGSDVEGLLNVPDIKKVQGKRDRAILEVFYATGLRVSELTSLNRDSLVQGRSQLLVPPVSGETSRIVFLSSRAFDWVDAYLKSRKDNAKALFISHKRDPSRLTPRSVQRMIKKYTKKIGLSSDVTPKTLRHSFATDLLIAGADIRSVQEMLGHKNISTTQIYTHVTNRQLRDVHSAFHGKGGK
ncbi:MAG: tyrosine-type recombinase/integrase [Patescibacteria group bacterium]